MALHHTDNKIGFLSYDTLIRSVMEVWTELIYLGEFFLFYIVYMHLTWNIVSEYFTGYDDTSRFISLRQLFSRQSQGKKLLKEGGGGSTLAIVLMVIK